MAPRVYVYVKLHLIIVSFLFFKLFIATWLILEIVQSKTDYIKSIILITES